MRTRSPPAPAKSAGTHESDDAFLGRLQHHGVHIHEIAARNLQTNRCGETPEPTDLHRDLLRLYLDSGAVRIVTTNFDLLFNAAAQVVFSEAPELFKAPALPLGGSFNGVVHVHGSLYRPHEMVLTDADFGRAYLTEGWARRFLVELFRSFTVMFVGYSHDDTVMKYLARPACERSPAPVHTHGQCRQRPVARPWHHTHRLSQGAR